MRMAAHELLETAEALRTKAAEIEQHGFFAANCKDQTLKNMLRRHQQQMIQAYQQGVNLLQGKGAQVTHMHPDFHMDDVNMGMENSAPSTPPNPNAKTLSDRTISTLVLNAHKSGAMMGMLWANECVDPQIRSYHVQGANLCQEMAYEMWQWMNQNGYYNPPVFQQNQINQMAQSFQPISNMNMMNSMNMNQNMNQNMNNFGNNQGMFS